MGHWGPQPALLDVLRRILPHGPILDVGCGSGDLAIALAEEGYPVLGIDFVPAAVDQALMKAAALPPALRARLEFRVADACVHRTRFVGRPALRRLDRVEAALRRTR